MMDVSGEVLRLVTSRQDRMEHRLDEVEDKTEGIPELRRSVDRLITAVYAAAGLIVISAVGVILIGPATP